MINSIKIVFLAFLILAVGQLALCQSLPKQKNDNIVKTASEIVARYNKEKPTNSVVVKVVYFHGNDRPPCKKWKARLTRTLDAVSNFYKEEFDRFGVTIDGIPFERTEKGYNITVVKGSLTSRSYRASDGFKICDEIKKSTNGNIDFSKQYVLVFTGLNYQRSNGTYVFHSPYYAINKGGFNCCFVADCDLLDPQLLTNVDKKMTFSERFLLSKECHVAEFNSWYIGGVAHELGHVFGLPHNFGNPFELNSSNISLMGKYGSRHFKDYLWGGKQSAFISQACLFQMLSHPVFSSNSKKNVPQKNLKITKLDINKGATGFKMTIDFDSNGKPYGIVALNRDIRKSTYYNRSFSNVISNQNRVELTLGNMTGKEYMLQLMFLYPDGGRAIIEKKLKIKLNSEVEVNDYSQYETFKIDDFKETLLKQRTYIDKRLALIEQIQNAEEPVDLSTTRKKQLSLSDAKWESASVGWGVVARNYYSRESRRYFFLSLKNKVYAKGIYAHSPSLYRFNLNGKWSSFSATIGLRDGADKQGSAYFTVIGDGKVLYRSKALRANQVEHLDVDIEGVRILELKTEETEGHNRNSWAIWVEPIVKK